MTDTFRRTPSLPSGLTRSDLLTAVATGLLTLPDPARRSPLGRFALRTAAAGTVAAMMWAGTREDERAQLDATARVGLTAGAVGLTYGGAELGEALDRALQRRLVTAGVRRPRVAMALANAGLALAMSVLDRRAGRGEDDDEAFVDVPVLRDLPGHVRELISAILEQTEDHESLRLRAQLAVAREEVWGEAGDDAPRFVELSVPDDVPLTVPRNFTFPVSARFRSESGVPCTVQLGVTDGKLRTLLVDIDGEPGDDVTEPWYPGSADPDPLAGVGLPSLADVILVTEGGD